MRKLVLLSAFAVAAFSALSLHAHAADKHEIHIENSSKRAAWITIYLTRQHTQKVGYGCVVAGGTLTLKHFNFETRPDYWPLAEIKERANDCNGPTKSSQYHRKTNSFNLWIVPQYRDRPDSMGVITDRKPE